MPALRGLVRISTKETKLVKILLFFCATVLLAQPVQPPGLVQGQLSHVSRKQLPGKLSQLIDLSSDRFDQRGKERVQMLASVRQLTPARSINVRLSQQWREGLRVDNLSDNSSFTYTGTGLALSKGTADARDLGVAEIFAHDSVEGLMDQFANGSRIRLVGQNVRVQDPRARNPLGGACDLYEIEDTSRLRGNQVCSLKTFCFDPVTGQLRSVVYRTGADHIETRYEQWQTLQNQPFPRLITRIENDNRTLEITITAATVLAAAQDNLFRIQ